MFSLTRLWQAFPYDTGRIKAIETSSNSEIFRRLGLIAPGALAAWLIFDEILFLKWYVIYVGILMFWQAVLRQLPARIGPGLTVFVLVLTTLNALAFLYAAFYAWGREEFVLKLLAVLMMQGSMLNSISVRSQEPVLTAADLIILTACGIYFPVSYWMAGSSLPEVIFLGMAIWLILIYYGFALRDVLRSRRLLEQAQQSELARQRVESLGQLTGGVAHDFNNLLTVILGSLELHREAATPAEKEALLQEVEGAARRAAAMTGQLLAYSRRSTLRPQRTQIFDTVQEATMMLRRLLPANVELELDDPGNLPEVMIDAGKLETAIVNLALNARDAMPEGGKLTIRGRRCRVGPGDTLRPLIPRGDYACLTIEDTGTGIPRNIANRVVEPYFTTKPVGKGSGLGLPMAMGFAEQSGGRLTLDSAIGQGTRVTLWFPAAWHAPK